jgi:hypothetical protein
VLGLFAQLQAGLPADPVAPAAVRP